MEEMPSLVKKRRHPVTKKQPGCTVAEEHDILSLHSTQGWSIIRKHQKIFNDTSWASGQVSYRREKRLSGQKEMSIWDKFSTIVTEVLLSCHHWTGQFLSSRAAGKPIANAEWQELVVETREEMFVIILPCNVPKIEFFNSQKEDKLKSKLILLLSISLQGVPSLSLHIKGGGRKCP